MSYFSWVPNFSSLVDFPALAKSKMMITFSQSIGVVAVLAGVVGVVAAPIFAEIRYLFAGVIMLCLGGISWFYCHQFQSVNLDLQNRITLEEAAKKVENEGGEILETVGQLNQQLTSMKSLNDDLGSKVEKLKEENSKLIQYIKDLENGNSTLKNLHQQLIDIEGKLNQKERELTLKVEEQKQQAVKSLEESKSKLDAMKEMLEKINKIYGALI